MGSIFISHHHSDDACATQIAQWLAQRGHLSAFTDHLAIHGGEYWMQRIYRELMKSDVVIIVLSERWTNANWCFAELAVAWALGKKGKVIPLRLGSFDPPNELKSIEIIDFNNVDAGFERLAVSLRALDVAAWDASRVPYLGLHPFSSADAAIFFGRDADTKDAVSRLNNMRLGGQRRLMVLAGDSGSGKSSLVKAAVLPAFANDADWKVLEPITPAWNHFGRLADMLEQALRQAPHEKDRLDVRELLRRAANPGQGAAVLELADVVLRASGRRDASILVTIDQFERLLSDGDVDEDARFLGLVCNLAQEPRSPFVVLCVLRSDFLHRFLCHPLLGSLPKEQKFLGPIAEHGLRSVICEPARIAAGVTFDEQLVQELIRHSMSGSGSSLPLLGYVLQRLWKLRESRLPKLQEIGMVEYRAIGQFAGAIVESAESCWATAFQSKHDESAVQAAFLSMVRVKGDVYLSEGARRDMFSDETNRILDLFRAQGLLVSRTDPAGQPTIEFAHEVLLRQWPRLAEWLKPEKEFLEWRTRLAAYREAAPDEPLHGLRLLEARSWQQKRAADLSAAERELLALSEQRYQAETARRLAATATALAQDIRQLPKAALLAAEAMSRVPSSEAAAVLRRALGHLAQRHQLLSHPAAVNVVAVADHGGWVATASEDGTLKVWQGRPLTAAWETRQGDRFVSLAIDLKERWLAAVGSSGAVGLWDLKNGRPVTSLSEVQDAVELSFAPDGGSLAVLCGRPGSPGALCMFETGSWKKLWQMDGVTAFAFHPTDAQGVAACGNQIRYWDALAGAMPLTLTVSASIIALCFHPTYLLIAALTMDERLWLCSPEVTAENQAEFKCTSIANGILRTSPLIFSADNQYLAALGRDFVIRAWSLHNHQEILREPIVGIFGLQLAFGPNGVLALASPDDQAVRFWQMGRPGLLALIEQGQASAVRFMDAGRELITASHADAASTWTLPTGNDARWTCVLGLCSQVHFSPDGQWLAWTGTTIGEGGRIITAAMGASFFLIQVGSGRVVASARFDATIKDVAFEPAGCVAARSDGATRVWRLGDTAEEVTVSVATDKVWPSETKPSAAAELPATVPPAVRERLGGRFAVSTDGRWLAATERSQAPVASGPVVANASRRIQVLDLSTGSVIARMQHMEPVSTLVFSPDGSLLVSVGLDAATHCWEIDPDVLIERVCRRLNSPISAEDWRLYVGDEPYRDIRSRIVPGIDDDTPS
jgi:WD40 repeat protein